MSDLISRKDAIAALRKEMHADVDMMSDLICVGIANVLNGLPAQPDLTEEDWRLIKKLRAYHNGSYAMVLDKLIAMASAQPERKRGKWIFIRDEEAGNALYACSECGKGDIHAPEVRVSYCWHCGADMRGDSDEA